ncbi:MAG: hypothetical protein Ct9H90mP22_4590 [Gammaproteobacteria bacterium]|nr:MAG: hypothetical protein Ct9H90mP22_4590 [Gammaproteobacteria bacterium]
MTMLDALRAKAQLPIKLGVMLMNLSIGSVW